jgi:hypothetical protein
MGLVPFAQRDSVGVARLIESEPVGDQRSHVDFTLGDEIDERRQIAALGPANVAERVIDPFPFVFRVVRPGPIGT